MSNRTDKVPISPLFHVSHKVIGTFKYSLKKKRKALSRGATSLSNFSPTCEILVAVFVDVNIHDLIAIVSDWLTMLRTEQQDTLWSAKYLSVYWPRRYNIIFVLACWLFVKLSSLIWNGALILYEDGACVFNCGNMGTGIKSAIY